MYKHFDEFKTQLNSVMPKLLGEILSVPLEEKVGGIAFVTSDDFYGIYVPFETEQVLKKLMNAGEDKGRWRWFPDEWRYSDANLPSSYRKELYSNLVAVIEANEEIDFCNPSANKWAFAISYMDAIGDAISNLPESFFETYGYRKQDILFLAAMNDGDYINEMLVESAKKYNSPEKAKAFIEFFEECNNVSDDVVNETLVESVNKQFSPEEAKEFIEFLKENSDSNS